MYCRLGAHELSFMYEGKFVTLRGESSLHQSKTNLQTFSCASLTPTFGWESGLAASQVLSVQAPQQIQDVLDQFMGVFQTPSGLPPVRSRDHTIMLQPRVTSISVRPYHYPQESKTSMEQMVAEMLQRCCRLGSSDLVRACSLV